MLDSESDSEAAVNSDGYTTLAFSIFYHAPILVLLVSFSLIFSSPTSAGNSEDAAVLGVENLFLVLYGASGGVGYGSSPPPLLPIYKGGLGVGVGVGVGGGGVGGGGGGGF